MKGNDEKMSKNTDFILPKMPRNIKKNLLNPK